MKKNPDKKIKPSSNEAKKVASREDVQKFLIKGLKQYKRTIKALENK